MPTRPCISAALSLSEATQNQPYTSLSAPVSSLIILIKTLRWLHMDVQNSTWTWETRILFLPGSPAVRGTRTEFGLALAFPLCAVLGVASLLTFKKSFIKLIASTDQLT